MIPSDPEVMGIDKEPKAGPDAPYDLRTPYHDYLLRKMLPADKMEARGSHATPSPSP